MGILAYCAFDKFFAPLMVAAHILTHTELSKRMKDVKGVDEEEEDECDNSSFGIYKARSDHQELIGIG